MMETRIQNKTQQRDVRRKVGCRLACHWVLFFVVAIFLTAVLEFLFGEPRQPSFALLGEAFQKHSVLFATLLVLIPMSLRDCLRCVDKAVFTQSRTEASPLLARAPVEELRQEPKSAATDRVETATRPVSRPSVPVSV